MDFGDFVGNLFENKISKVDVLVFWLRTTVSLIDGSFVGYVLFCLDSLSFLSRFGFLGCSWDSRVVVLTFTFLRFDELICIFEIGCLLIKYHCRYLSCC